MPHGHPQARVSPIFPVSDLRRSLDHDAALGCSGRPDDGLREGWHIHPDGNLLRLGSPLASPR